MRVAATSTTSSTMPNPRLQAISFFSIGSSGSAAIFLISSPTFGADVTSAFIFIWFIVVSSWSTGHRRLHAGEEQPRNDEAHPDDESEQAHQVHGGELADAFLPELAEIRHHADGEEREHEEDAAEHVRLTHRRLHLAHRLRRGGKGDR